MNELFYRKLALLALFLLMLSACTDKKSPSAPEAADSTAVSTATEQDGQAAEEDDSYDLEAIAKAIEGCEDLGSFSHGLAGVKKDGKVGYIDKKGRTVIPFEYDGPIQGFSEGIVTVYKGGDDIYMDTSGKELFRTQSFGRYFDGLSTVREDGLIGFKDTKGNVVIPCQFNYAGDFSDGMCWVTKNTGKIGFIDTTGKMVIPCQFEWPSERSPNDFHEGLCCVMVDGEHEWFGYIDKTGKRAFPGFYNSQSDFKEGLAYVSEVIRNGEDFEIKDGYIDKTGKYVIELEKDCWGTPFYDGVAIVRKVGNPVYAIDKTGKKVFDIDPQIKNFDNYGDGVWQVWDGNLMGYIDNTGKTILPCKYYAYKPFSEGLVALQDKQGGRWGFADKQGHTTFDF